jgi:predicted transcriptional regulator of viral defense system
VIERRDLTRRAALVERLGRVAADPSVVLTIRSVHESFEIPEDAAARLLNRLVTAGLLREVPNGLFVSSSR